MSFVALAVKELIRNKRRTLLTALSIAVGVFFFTVLISIMRAFTAIGEQSSPTRIVVSRSTSQIFSLPYRYLEPIRRLPGVVDATCVNFFGGVYRDRRSTFSQFAIDAVSYFRVYPEIEVPPEQRAAFLQDRTGALVGENLIRRFDWKVGDPLVIRPGIAAYGTRNFTFTIRGVYRTTSRDTEPNAMLFHWQYANERMVPSDRCGQIGVQTASPDAAVAVAELVDKEFANSLDQTRTQTERAYRSSVATSFGSLNALLSGMLGLSIVTMLVVAGNIVAMSVRDRTREIAVMRALGFRRSRVAALILGESILVAVIGGAGGSSAAYFLATGGRVVNGVAIPRFVVSTELLLLGIAVGGAIGLAAAAVPVALASRKQIVDALRSV